MNEDEAYTRAIEILKYLVEDYDNEDLSEDEFDKNIMLHVEAAREVLEALE